jgi:hypothetical protein
MAREHNAVGLINRLFEEATRMADSDPLAIAREVEARIAALGVGELSSGCSHSARPSQGADRCTDGCDEGPIDSPLDGLISGARRRGRSRRLRSRSAGLCSADPPAPRPGRSSRSAGVGAALERRVATDRHECVPPGDPEDGGGRS